MTNGINQKKATIYDGACFYVVFVKVYINLIRQYRAKYLPLIDTNV